MSTKPATATVEDDGIQVFRWAGITEADEGTPVRSPYTHRSVQAVGNFGVSGAITIEGSNDGSNWGTLTDPSGSAIVLSNATPVEIATPTIYLRPRASAGTGVLVDVIAASFTRRG